MSDKLQKKVLVVLVDYSPTTLKAVKRLMQLGFDVTILSSYDFNSVPDWFKYIGHKLFRNIYKRKKYAREVLGKEQNLVKILSGNFWFIWAKSIWKLLRMNIHTHNVQRQYVQHVMINRVNYNAFVAIYAFDTYAYNFQKKSQEFGLQNILQSRGMHFKYSLEINKKLNQLFNTAVRDVDTYIKDEQSREWYNKLIAEPNLADFMIFYSMFHRKIFLEYSEVKIENSIIIPLSVVIPKSLKITKVGGEVLRFVYVGNLSYGKGIPILLEAFKKLQLEDQSNIQVELHLFGKLQIKEIEQMLNSSENVFYHGIVDNSILMERLHEFHVFIFPSLFDTFGMALAEALHNNLPIISNYTCGAAELYTEQEHGLKCKNSFSSIELMQAMKKFLDKPELVEEYSRNLAMLPAFNEDFINEEYKEELQKLKNFMDDTHTIHV